LIYSLVALTTATTMYYLYYKWMNGINLQTYKFIKMCAICNNWKYNTPFFCDAQIHSSSSS
jgi:hypothetical protein